MNDIDTISDVLRQLVSDVLRVEMAHLDNAVPLVDYGLDSLRAISLVVAIEQRFTVLISDDELEQLTTIAEITDFLLRGQS
ncbi:MAG: Phosphopantetheine attachment site [Mycobacterium sp.]|nr:Phosphopantetheine attachment site [Mycobacterium sp.]